MSFQELAGELTRIFRRGVDRPIAEEEFNDLALRVFRFQCRANQAFRGFVARRGVDPEAVERWEEIPHLPTLAFKTVPLVSGDPRDVERIFRTSGTTGTERRGEHHVMQLALYREALLPNLRAHLIPDEVELPVLCLLPSPDDVPESSLSFMMGCVVRGSPEGAFFLDPEGGILVPAFLARLRAAEERGEPVLLAGTAFAFVHWLDLAREGEYRVELPQGSRIMETGGYKGRSRALSRDELYRGLEGAFGVPEEAIVNEYGMTELLSQFYEPVLCNRGSAKDSKRASEGGSVPRSAGALDGGGMSAGSDLALRFHRGPPWVRTRVLDPLTLAPLGEGETGVLAHMDLANLGSVSAVLTEDLGRLVQGGFQLLGRSPGAEPRGCSLSMEDFLASVRSKA